MQAIAAGDRTALSALYDRYSPIILAVCRRILRDATEAEDVLTDIFFEVWTKSDRFDRTRGTPVTYLMTLARSRSIDRKRQRTSRAAYTSESLENSAVESESASPLVQSDLDEQRQIIRQAMNCLDAAQRQAVECAFFDDLSHSEIAEKLKKPLGTIKTNIRQGLIRLREALRNRNEAL